MIILAAFVVVLAPTVVWLTWRDTGAWKRPEEKIRFRMRK